MNIKRFFTKKKIIFILLIISWFVGIICFGDEINHTDLGGFIFAGISCGIMGMAIMAFVKFIKSTADKLLIKRRDTEQKMNSIYAAYCHIPDDTFYVNKGTQEVNWVTVVTALVVFFPLGLFYMIMKAIKEKSKYYSNGVKMKIIGTVFMIITFPLILLLIISKEDIATKLFLGFIPGIYASIGIASFITGLVFKEKGKTNEDYLMAIFSDKETRIDVLAKRQNATYSQAVAVIEKLIDTGFIKNGYIYHADREVIVPGISKKIAYNCKYCGGTTVQYSNEEKICVYCGAKQYEI